MDSFHEFLREALADLITEPYLVALLNTQRLSEHGLAVEDEQINELAAKLSAEMNSSPASQTHQHFESVPINLDFVGELFGETARQVVAAINFCEGDYTRLEQNVEERIRGLALDLVSSATEEYVRAWQQQTEARLGERRAIASQFQGKIEDAWGKALEYLEILIEISSDEGVNFYTKYRSKAAKENDYVFDALTRLHARGCQTARAILTLLRAGFADDAHGRWRTLNEISVVASFIRERGQDVAERYLFHRHITDYHELREYQEHCRTLGLAPFSEEEERVISDNRDSLLQRYGKPYDSQYGWAANSLGKSGPTFKQIEQAIGTGHVRPYYLMGNNNVHAGSKGILFRLGDPNGETLLAGPSMYGLVDPGRNTASSLMLLNAVLLLLRPMVDSIAVVKALNILRDNVHEAFSEAERRHH